MDGHVRSGAPGYELEFDGVRRRLHRCRASVQLRDARGLRLSEDCAWARCTDGVRKFRVSIDGARWEQRCAGAARRLDRCAADDGSAGSGRRRKIPGWSVRDGPPRIYHGAEFRAATLVRRTYEVPPSPFCPAQPDLSIHPSPTLAQRRAGTSSWCRLQRRCGARSLGMNPEGCWIPPRSASP